MWPRSQGSSPCSQPAGLPLRWLREGTLRASNTLKGTHQRGSAWTWGPDSLPCHPAPAPLPAVPSGTSQQGCCPHPRSRRFGPERRGVNSSSSLSLDFGTCRMGPRDRVVRRGRAGWGSSWAPSKLHAPSCSSQPSRDSCVHSFIHPPRVCRALTESRARGPLGTRPQEGQPCEGSAETPEAGAEASRVSEGGSHKPRQQAVLQGSTRA